MPPAWRVVGKESQVAEAAAGVAGPARLQAPAPDSTGGAAAFFISKIEHLQQKGWVSMGLAVAGAGRGVGVGLTWARPHDTVHTYA